MDLWIAHGVTSVADMGSDIGTLNAWTDRRNAFGAPVPRLFSFGSMVESMPFQWGGSAFGTSDEQMRDIIQLEKKQGAVGVKCYFTLQWPLHRAVASEAFKQRLPVSVHGCFREEIVRGALIGHEREKEANQKKFSWMIGEKSPLHSLTPKKAKEKRTLV